MFVTNSFTIKNLSWNENIVPIPFFSYVRFIKYGFIENITALDTFDAFNLTHLSPNAYIMKRRENLLNTFASTY